MPTVQIFFNLNHRHIFISRSLRAKFFRYSLLFSLFLIPKKEDWSETGRASPPFSSYFRSLGGKEEKEDEGKRKDAPDFIFLSLSERE